MPNGIYPVNWGTYNIRPVGDPGDPMLDEARTLSALMTAQARAARAMGGGGGGGKEKATSGKMLLNVDGKPQWVDVPGSTGQERMQNAKMMQKAYDEALVQNRTATLTESLADWGNMSNKRKADTLARVKADVLPSLSQGLDKKQTEALTAALAPYDKSQKEEQRTIEEDKGFWNQLMRRTADATANAYDATRAYYNDWAGDTQAADAARRDIAERTKAASQEPYIREQALREAEGEDWLSRQSGATGSLRGALGAAIGEFAPEGLAGVAAMGATALSGGWAAPLASSALRVGIPLATGALTGAGVNAAADLGGTTARIMADESIPMEQRLAGAREVAGEAAAVGAGIGAIPGVATPFIRPVQALRAGRALAKQKAKTELSEAAAKEAREALVNQAQARTLGNFALDATVGTAEQALLNVADLTQQNRLYGEAVGKDVDLTEGMGAALAASVPFGILGGYAHYRGRPRSSSQAATDARVKLGFEPAPTAEADASWSGAANAFGRQFDESFKKVSADDLAAGLTPELLHPQVQRAMLAERMVRPDLDPNFKVNELDFMRMVRDQSSEGSFWKTEQGGKIFDAYEKYANEHPEILNAGRPQNTAGAEGAGTNGAGARAATDVGQAERSATGPDVAGNPPSGDSVGTAAAKRGASPDAAGTQSPDGNPVGNTGARAGEQPVPGAGPTEAGNVNAQKAGTPAGKPRADSGTGTGAESSTIPPEGAGQRGAAGEGVGGAGNAQRPTNDAYNKAVNQKTPRAIYNSLKKAIDERGLMDKNKLHSQAALDEAIVASHKAFERASELNDGANNSTVKQILKLRSELISKRSAISGMEYAYHRAKSESVGGIYLTPEEAELFNRYANDLDAVNTYLDDLRNSGNPELEAMANWLRNDQNSPWAEKLKNDASTETRNRAEGLDGELSNVPPSELAADVASNTTLC